MKQLCISSTVLNRHITLNYDELVRIKGLQTQLIHHQMPFWSIVDNGLEALQYELESIIDSLLISIEITAKKNIKIVYKGTVYDLDFTNNDHFTLAALIDIYNFSMTTRDLRGHITVFNKELLKKSYGENIVAQLRGQMWLTEDELYAKINRHWNEFKVDEILDREILQKGIEQLTTFGLIYKDERTNGYSVTAIGYMYW